jgi:hypothetical protein
LGTNVACDSLGSDTKRGREGAANIAAVLAGFAIFVSGIFVGAPATHAEEAIPNSETSEETYDAYQGMDSDGRIPKIDKAAHVDRPQRWRYIPEGRIKPGNFLDRFLVSSFAVPLIFSDQDVGTGFGIALTDIDFRNQRRREFLGGFFSYTTEEQQSYVLRWRRWSKHIDVPEGGVLQEERSFLRAGGGYRKTLTRRFFGIGPSTQERQETSFTDGVGFVDLGLSTSLDGALDNFVIELGIRGEHHSLNGGKVGGEPTTEALFPGLFREADHIILGWLSAGVRWDTRDSQRNPYRGSVIGAVVDAALGQTGGDVGATYRIYADQIFPLWPLFHSGGDEHEENPPTDSLAIHFETQLSSGELPFFARPTLGGSRLLRGYIAGRWRDDALWGAIAEYRFWVISRGFTVWRHIRIERIGAAVFYEVGGVAEDGVALFRERVRQSYGISARMTMERAALFRVDFGFSEEGLNFSAGFGLSF